MSTLADRIRRARALAKMSQQALADMVGVQRAAVTQWESNKGHMPTMCHLITIATATGVMVEWLGTGRGPIKPETEEWIQAVRSDDYAQDDGELECLLALRRLPVRVRDHAIGMVKLMADGYGGPDRPAAGEVKHPRRNGVETSRQ